MSAARAPALEVGHTSRRQNSATDSRNSSCSSVKWVRRIGGWLGNTSVHPSLGPATPSEGIAPPLSIIKDVPTVLLVRHGQASFGAEDYDVLSPAGVRQSALLAEALRRRGVEPARLVSGTLRRQTETAAAFAEFGEPATDERWNEYDANEVLTHHSQTETRLDGPPADGAGGADQQALPGDPRAGAGRLDRRRRGEPRRPQLARLLRRRQRGAGRARRRPRARRDRASSSPPAARSRRSAAPCSTPRRRPSSPSTAPWSTPA